MRGSNKKHIYISCSLTHVPQSRFGEHHAFINDIADMIEIKYGLNVKNPVRDCDPFLPCYSPEERASRCYQWDKEMVKDSFLLVVEASFPATGVGMEVQMAEHYGIPVVLLYRNYGDNRADEKNYQIGDKLHSLQIGNGIVPLMLQGCPAVLAEIRYSAPADGLARLGGFLEDFLRHHPLD